MALELVRILRDDSEVRMKILQYIAAEYPEDFRVAVFQSVKEPKDSSPTWTIK